MWLFTCILSTICLFEVDSKTGHSFSEGKNLSNGKSEVPVHPPLLIGSFNIQTLGSKKFKNPDVIYTVEKIIHRYDVILLMEIMTSDSSFMRNFLRDVNLFSPEGVTYNMTLSYKHPITTEHSAILYRTNKLKLLRTKNYYDPQKFYRQPFIAIFEAYTLRDMAKFGLIGHHAKPSQAVMELDALADVYDYAVGNYGTKDMLLMGDFNADCTYVREGDWDKIALWTRPEFTWPIAIHTDTTTNYKSCALDRFVHAGENMNNGVILGSAQVFDFQKEFDLTTEETRKISDHWPIELKIRGKLSDLAEKHLTSDICFKIKDSKARGGYPTQDELQSLKSANINVTETADGILLAVRTTEESELVSAMSRLRSSLPNVMTHELNEAIKYKIEHRSLNDESSFADIWEPSYLISMHVTAKYAEASVCRTTSIN